MAWGIYGFWEVITRPQIENQMRSLILELGVNLKCKIQILQPVLCVSVAFWNRHDIYKILKKFNEIDEMVSGMKNIN